MWAPPLQHQGSSGSVRSRRRCGPPVPVNTHLTTASALWLDCWKSTETCRHVFITVDGTLSENQNPTPQREAEELQQVVLVPLTNLQQTLNHFETEKKYLIDSRLRCLAMGLELRGHGIM